jgi:23S rRNA pseudouridine1911/1915/1917 synthase
VSSAPFPILYEDNHLLVVVKPPGIPTMGVGDDRTSALALARAYVKQKYDKPGKVYLGVVSRLDAPVSGVLVFARTSKAAARLTEQFRSRSVEKIYWAVVEGDVEPPQATLTDWLVHDDRHRRMHATDIGTPPAQQATLFYRKLKRLQQNSLLEVTLETGRKHQIRVQFARRGHSIVGDRKYGSQTELRLGIALFARRLKIEHPIRHEALEFIAPVPPTWHKLGVNG